MSAPTPPPPSGPDDTSQVLHRDPVVQAGFVQLANVLLFNPRLSPQALRLYAVLKTHAWRHGHAFPGQDCLAQELGCNTRSIRYYLSELQTLGLLTVEQRGLRQSNRYFLEEPGPDWQPPATDCLSDRQNLARSHPKRQKVADQDRQDSASQDRQDSADIRRSRSEEDRIEEDDLETSPPLEAVSDDAPPPFSAWIANTIHDHLRELGDPEYQRAPLTQVNRALALWQRSDLPEATFVDLLHQVRNHLRANQSHIAKRGAWYFAALERASTEARHAS